MFCVIYHFKILPDKDEEFIDAWTMVTEAFKIECGALGSRLHKNQHGDYIAYAQWPSKEIRDQAELPDDVKRDAFAQMRACCDRIETLFEMNPVADLLEPVSQESG